MDPIAWIAILTSVIILGQFGVIIALVIRKPWFLDRIGARPPKFKYKTQAQNTKANHIDIDSRTQTLSIPDVDSANVGVEEKKIKNSSQLEKLRNLKK